MSVLRCHENRGDSLGLIRRPQGSTGRAPSATVYSLIDCESPDKVVSVTKRKNAARRGADTKAALARMRSSAARHSCADSDISYPRCAVSSAAGAGVTDSSLATTVGVDRVNMTVKHGGYLRSREAGRSADSAAGAAADERFGALGDALEQAGGVGRQMLSPLADLRGRVRAAFIDPLLRQIFEGLLIHDQAP